MMLVGQTIVSQVIIYHCLKCLVKLKLDTLLATTVWEYCNLKADSDVVICLLAF